MLENVTQEDNFVLDCAARVPPADVSYLDKSLVATMCTIVLSRQISLSTNTWLSNVETTVADYKWIYSRSTGKLWRLLLRTDKGTRVARMRYWTR